MPKRVTKDEKLENIRLLFRPNFSGEKRQFNNEGQRNFNIELDLETAEYLMEAGWTVKTWDRVDDEGNKTVIYFLKVKVNMEGRRPPKVFLISTTRNNEPRRTPLDADTVEILDALEFENIDVILSPHNYDFNGSQGVTAYLKTGFFVLAQNDLEKKYAHIPIDEGFSDGPKEIENVIDVDADWEDEEELALTSGES